MASAMGYSMLESAARDGGVRPYPLLRRHNYAQLQLAATLTITVTLTCVFSLLIGLLMFMGVEEDSAAMMRKYGSHKCPKGPNMLDHPINNFSPCCTHYSTTCCNLHGERCRAGYDFAKPSFPRTDKCEELLALLSCARCSSFAGHYDNSDPTVPLTVRPNLTVCNSFCDEVWMACAVSFQPTSDDGLPRFGAREFCTEQLGLRVPELEDSACFSGGSLGALPTVWLSSVVPIVLALWQVCHK